MSWFAVSWVGYFTHLATLFLRADDHWHYLQNKAFAPDPIPSYSRAANPQVFLAPLKTGSRCTLEIKPGLIAVGVCSLAVWQQ